MAAELASRGFADYRLTDAATLRRLRRGPASVGELGVPMGVTRQAARKVVRGLEERGYASTQADADDARKLNVTLTSAGRAYANADAITEVIAGLNRAVAARVAPDQLATADAILRASIDDEGAPSSPPASVRHPVPLARREAASSGCLSSDVEPELDHVLSPPRSIWLTRQG